MSAPPARERSPARARACIAAVLVALGAGGASVAVASAASKPRTSLPAIERQVMCVTCKIPLNVAESTQANDERAYIQELVDRGYGEAQIKRALVGQYGPAVLGLPAAHGFDLTVYLVPIAVLVALAATVALLLPRWRARTRAAAPGSAPAPMSEAEREQLERDMARFE